MKPIYKDVRTGRMAPKHSLSKPGYRLGEEWFEVKGFECTLDCICDGFEICLHHIGKDVRGGGHSGPIWPILSCRSEEEVKEMMPKLIAFARTLDANERQHNYFDKEINGDSRLAAWLTEQGFRRRNHVVWTREAA